MRLNVRDEPHVMHGTSSSITPAEHGKCASAKLCFQTANSLRRPQPRSFGLKRCAGERSQPHPNANPCILTRPAVSLGLFARWLFSRASRTARGVGLGLIRYWIIQQHFDSCQLGPAELTQGLRPSSLSEPYSQLAQLGLEVEPANGARGQAQVRYQDRSMELLNGFATCADAAQLQIMCDRLVFIRTSRRSSTVPPGTRRIRPPQPDSCARTIAW